MMLATTRRAAIRPVSPRRRSAFTLIEVLVVVAILVILATIAAVAVPKQLNEARKSRAQIGCVTIARAAEAYQINQANPGTTDDERMPQGINDLLNPSWTTSFLPEGQASAVDPWGKQYNLQIQQRNDGNGSYILVHTTAPDGTEISQFGLGANSRPKN
ncbi:general secretion pathway protein g : General secretion pathway protein G OS=Sphingobium yanoikuyae ATCC 51230 GN=HMPREF9718_03863 PE=4 SV=1: N_methyl_2: T2SG [Gemmata massiliana]|uniref:Type II secretion system core protein G n=1 Tax=Gemmata massiliana TaxID=1210884 RepID=A0A6P2CXD7_9BACT|nr:prepilin-type N-terminal cleavage/methylation domain-containing protein [Gemmata massiliana]VTR91830.1 general secretion pathway protein g : General secretion pathway protein G OS=Sphingobium yanoikuyae ATCC 51230 GN=HMPREF9718_03863 PE=4 SV=1: N_methyl_2: T2SG [Gemmata massiliana]